MFSRRDLLAKSPLALLFTNFKKIPLDENPAFKMHILNYESTENLKILNDLYPNGYHVTLRTFQNLVDHGFNTGFTWPITGQVNYPDKQVWYLNGKRHRTNGPALIYTSGTKEWYLNGKLHRENGPAFICPHNNSYCWYQHGKLHRENGPAAKYQNGQESWYLHGKQHRLDGPAFIRSDGTQYWRKHGKKHRENGPAVIYPNGICEYWINGEFKGSTHA